MASISSRKVLAGSVGSAALFRKRQNRRKTGNAKSRPVRGGLAVATEIAEMS
jgi:hypothetical protein